MSLALVSSIFAVVAMGSKWSFSLESTRPPDGSTRFVLVGARRVFASSTNTCFLSGRRLCSSHRSHPGCFCGELVEAVSEAFSGGDCGCLPRWPLERCHCFCCKTYQGEEQMQEEDLRCSGSIHIFLQQAFSSLNVSGLLPFGCNKLCIIVSALGLSSL